MGHAHETKHLHSVGTFGDHHEAPNADPHAAYRLCIAGQDGTIYRSPLSPYLFSLSVATSSFLLLFFPLRLYTTPSFIRSFIAAELLLQQQPLLLLLLLLLLLRCPLGVVHQLAYVLYICMVYGLLINIYFASYYYSTSYSSLDAPCSSCPSLRSASGTCLLGSARRPSPIIRRASEPSPFILQNILLLLAGPIESRYTFTTAYEGLGFRV